MKTYSQGTQPVDLNLIFDLDNLDNVKNDRIQSYTLDILILSCCSYRLRTTEPYTNYGLTNTVTQFVKDEDYIVASQIRDYYSKKLMIQKLKGGEMSKFRKTLSEFFYSDFIDKDTQYHQVPESITGLVYRLPEFYVYDKEFEKLFTNKSVNLQTFNGKVKLKFEKKLVRKNRLAINSIEYFFKDDNDIVYRLGFAESNQLLSLLDQVLEKPISVNGSFFVKKIDDFYFYNTGKFDISQIL